jgi:NADPH:quinone reductase
MKAVYVKEFGGAENLEFRKVENPPTPQKTQILVNVKASAINRADIVQRMGFYPAPKGYPERILGLEFAGEVAETGENVKKFAVGDRVFGITAGGANAEFLLTEESHLAKIPDQIGFVEAATFPEAFITANDAIFTQCGLKETESLLIHAVGSGVGLAALQLANAKNIRTFGTSRTLDKLEKCKEFGLSEPILANGESDFSDVVNEKTGGKGVDVILDLVGASYFESNLACAALKGRLILVGLVGGRTAEFNLGIALMKRLKIIGTALRGRSNDEKAEATREFIKNVLPLIESGAIKPNLDKVFKPEEVRKAHEYLESNESFGKVVLEF